jgi:glycerophosphoryl diester phosphodiesterase
VNLTIAVAPFKGWSPGFGYDTCLVAPVRNPFAAPSRKSSTERAMSRAERGENGDRAERPLVRPLVMAHRGASAVRPENTVAAFEHARVLGADWVELDVRASADGDLVVQHDASLPDGRAVSATATDELPADVASLDQALDACRGMGVNVEIKRDAGEPRDLPEPVTAALARREQADGHRYDQLLVSSFDPATIARVHELEPRLPTARLVADLGGSATDIAAQVAAAGHVALNPWDPLVDAELVDAAHEAGLSLYVWTVDEPDRLRELAALGVDGLITNVPDLAREVLG